MRHDHDYVREACDLSLTTSEKGHEHLLRLEGDVSDIPMQQGEERSEIVDLLAAVEQDYFILPNQANLQQMYEAYAKQYKEHYETRALTSFDGFHLAFMRNLISVKLVIWDADEAVERMKDVEKHFPSDEERA